MTFVHRGIRLILGALLAWTAGFSSPGTAPEPDPAAIVAAMSGDELIGQLLWLPVYGAQADSRHDGNLARYGVATPAEVVQRYTPGGVIYFGWADNIDNPAQIAQLSSDLQSVAGETSVPVPLAIGVDQEGGPVARIGAPATELPAVMSLGAAGDPALGHAYGEVLGQELAAMGINVNFAPTLDVNTNPANPVIGTRSVGETPELVADIGIAQLDGMARHGVSGVVKHFPGHGDTDVDSHTGLPVVTGDEAALAPHLEPFAAAIEAGADLVMSAHVVVSALDEELPATLSPAVLTGLLREELGFEGIITTDALDMAALKQLPGRPLSNADIAVMALRAGADVLLMPPDVDAAIQGIRDALESGELSRERLEESARRIVRWKLDAIPTAEAPSLEVVGSPAHRDIAAEIAIRGTTVLRNDNDVLPLFPGDPVAVWGGPDSALGVLLTEAGMPVSGTSETHAGELAVVEVAPDQRDAALTAAAELVDRGALTVVVLTASPYDYARLPTDTAAVVATYGPGGATRAAAAAVIAGAAVPGGVTPVTLWDRGGAELPVGTGQRLGSQTIPVAPEFRDVSADKQQVVIPAVAGVEYLLDGEPVGVGEHPAGAVAVVRARPTTNHWFPPGVVTRWVHDAVAPPPPPADPVPTNSPSTPASDESPSEDSSLSSWAVIGIGALVVLIAGSVVALTATRRRHHRAR